MHTHPKLSFLCRSTMLQLAFYDAVTLNSTLHPPNIKLNWFERHKSTSQNYFSSQRQKKKIPFRETHILTENWALCSHRNSSFTNLWSKALKTRRDKKKKKPEPEFPVQPHTHLPTPCWVWNGNLFDALSWVIRAFAPGLSQPVPCAASQSVLLQASEHSIIGHLISPTTPPPVDYRFHIITSWWKTVQLAVAAWVIVRLLFLLFPLHYSLFLTFWFFSSLLPSFPSSLPCSPP